MSEIKLCVDRVLSNEMATKAMELAIKENSSNQPSIELDSAVEMALVTGKKWANGRRLKVAFLDGDPTVQAKVREKAVIWSKYASIQFSFGNSPTAEIRISFAQQGSWSYIGTDALAIPIGQPTMNFGWLTPASEDEEYERVVVHEFGHALGCIHEHQNPKANIPWDEEKVYAYYMGPPNNWSREEVFNNLLRKYSTTITQFSSFDRQSIMLYPIPNEHTIGDYEVGWNRVLSSSDKSFISSMYPVAAKV